MADPLLGDDTVIARTIVLDGQVAGNVVCWEDSGKRLVGSWIGVRGEADEELVLELAEP